MMNYTLNDVNLTNDIKGLENIIKQLMSAIELCYPAVGKAYFYSDAKTLNDLIVSMNEQSQIVNAAAEKIAALKSQNNQTDETQVSNENEQPVAEQTSIEQPIIEQPIIEQPIIENEENFEPAVQSDTYETSETIETAEQVESQLEPENTDEVLCDTQNFTCVSCGAKIKNDAKFCTVCGFKVEPVVELTCKKCNAKLPTNAKFCNKCGAAVLTEPKEPANFTCSTCGKVCSDDVSYCTVCGTALKK